MKTIKLILGIICIALSPLILTIIFANTNKGLYLLDFLCVSSFVSAGIISVSTSGNNKLWTYILNTLLFLVCGLTLLIHLSLYFGSKSNSALIVCVFTFFLLAGVNLIFWARIYLSKQKSIPIHTVKSNENICPMCGTVFFNDSCPNCGANPKLSVKRCLYCGTKSQLQKCPNCGADLSKNIEGVLIDKNFSINKSLKGIYFSIYIDDMKKYCCIFNNLSQRVERIIPYNKILKVELYKDGETITSSNFNNALLGGVLFGAAGAVIGASTSKNTQNVCNYMSVVIYVDDLIVPTTNVDILKHPVNTTSNYYKDCVSFARNIISTFEYMINKSKRI